MKTQHVEIYPYRMAISAHILSALGLPSGRPRFTAGRSRELSDKRGNPSLELMIIALTAVEI